MAPPGTPGSAGRTSGGPYGTEGRRAAAGALKERGSLKDTTHRPVVRPEATMGRNAHASFGDRSFSCLSDG